MTSDRAFYRQTREGLFQYLRRESRKGEDHLWVSRSTSFDTFGPTLAFGVQSSHRPRPLHISVDGRRVRTEQMDTAERWLRVALPAGGGKRSIEPAAPSCGVPALPGHNEDARCLSFLLKGLAPSRSELYDLTRDATWPAYRYNGRQLPRRGPNVPYRHYR